jgi:dTDP-4-amino-4,6-dideoxygalactose transaminase
LHSSPAGRCLSRSCGPLTHTDSVSNRLIRFPLWIGMTLADVERIVGIVQRTLG